MDSDSFSSKCLNQHFVIVYWCKRLICFHITVYFYPFLDNTMPQSKVISSGFWFLISKWKIFQCIKQRTSITLSFWGPWQAEVKINKGLCFSFSFPNPLRSLLSSSCRCLVDKRFFWALLPFRNTPIHLDLSSVQRVDLNQIFVMQIAEIHNNPLWSPSLKRVSWTYCGCWKTKYIFPTNVPQVSSSLEVHYCRHIEHSNGVIFVCMIHFWHMKCNKLEKWRAR